MGARLEGIESAHQDTYEWIFTHENLGFLKWLASKEPFYWIRGKPASGKSTLMKMTLNDKRTSLAFKKAATGVPIIASFFFHNRGSALQRNLEGLLRDIIYKIANDVPALDSLLMHSYEE